MLSPQGHVEHAFYGVDDGEAFIAHTEPGQAAALVEFLDRMRFMMRVEVADVTSELAVTWRPRERPRGLRGYELVPRDQLTAYAEAAGPACGLWAFEALRIARGEPRLGLDTDHRTIPNEAGWIGPRRPPRQGLLPRPGDRRARPHAGPAAAAADAAPPRRLREPAARAAAPTCSTTAQGGRLRRHLAPATTSSARSRWPWSSATCRSTRPSRSTGCPPRRRCSSTPRSACTCGPKLR